MGIKSAMWYEHEIGVVNIKVTLDDDAVLWVPDDMTNRHRVELEEWSTVEGNEIKAYTPPPEAKPA